MALKSELKKIMKQSNDAVKLYRQHLTSAFSTGSDDPKTVVAKASITSGLSSILNDLDTLKSDALSKIASGSEMTKQAVLKKDISTSSKSDNYKMYSNLKMDLSKNVEAVKEIYGEKKHLYRQTLVIFIVRIILFAGLLYVLYVSIQDPYEIYRSPIPKKLSGNIAFLLTTFLIASTLASVAYIFLGSFSQVKSGNGQVYRIIN